MLCTGPALTPINIKRTAYSMLPNSRACIIINSAQPAHYVPRFMKNTSDTIKKIMIKIEFKTFLWYFVSSNLQE